MSLFSKSPDPYRTSNGFLPPAIDYVLDEFRTIIDITELQIPRGYMEGGEEILIRTLIDNSDHFLKKYGTAEEIAENAKIYKNFPGSHSFFGADASEPYNTTPIIYRSLTNKRYICKSDSFVILQNIIFQAVPLSESQVFRSMLAIFLKSQEERVNGKLEFVRYDPDVLIDIENEIQESMNSCISNQEEFERLKSEITKSKFDELCAKFRQLIQIVWKERSSSRIRALLSSFYNTLEQESRSNTMTILYTNSKTAIECLQSVINKRPEMFLPYSETKTMEAPITVRLFQDGPQKFVMKAELYEAINKASPECAPIVHNDGATFISTIEMSKVLEKYANRIYKIEFICTPILRAKHRAVPIKGLNSGESCVLAVDVLFNLLKKLIMASKVFQKASGNYWEDLIRCFQRMEFVYNPMTKNVQFFKLSAVPKFEEMFDKHLKAIQSFPDECIRSVNKEDGFTVDDLEDDLKHLGLTAIFPKITDYADDVYVEVMRVKKEKYLRTCDLFDAVEHCQLIVAFKRIPTLKKFLQGQKACRRVLTIKCDTCIAKLEDPSLMHGREVSGNDGASTINRSTKSSKPIAVSQKNEVAETSSVIQGAKCFHTSDMHNHKKGKRKRAKQMRRLNKHNHTVEEVKDRIKEKQLTTSDLSDTVVNSEIIYYFEREPITRLPWVIYV